VILVRKREAKLLKVGDYVIGHKKNDYDVTGPGIILRVERIGEQGYAYDRKNKQRYFSGSIMNPEISKDVKYMDIHFGDLFHSINCSEFKPIKLSKDKIRKYELRLFVDRL
jgi:hypothetical protein